MPTRQQTFDTVVNALRKQGCRSIKNERCFYRGEAGLKCAVGHLIPDEKYSPDMEGLTIYKSASNSLSRVGEVIKQEGHDLILCDRLQSTHDSYEVDGWERDFRKVAKRFGLVYSEPQDA